ncbi:MAG: NAD(P)-dependent oxidoreductase, partial [Acetobacteraceae bacterium]|nr:NAD(P)-dependent oxidoreductase [Acetobacteraceae bacterium]
MTNGAAMRGIFIDAGEELARIFHAVSRPGDPAVTINKQEQVRPADLPGLLAGYDFVLDDHSALPADALRGSPDLKHVIFLGTGARSYMDPEALAELGITVHTIKGYGDTAVAEHAIALMWAAARGVASMDRGVRAGGWPRSEGLQLTGKALGLIGFGGIAAEVARIAAGSGMRVLAWNRSPRQAPNVEFAPLERVLA